MSRLALFATAAALLAAAVTTPASAVVPAHTAQTCKAPKYPGTGYFTSLSVSGVGCATGQKFVLAWYRCRVKHGKAGRCTSAIMGFRCTEKRNAIPTEIDARVSCKKGRQAITHTYQQDL